MQYLYETEKRDQAGIALLIAVILMLMISAIGLSALQSAGGEASASGRSARKLTTFFAADSGMSVVMQQLDTTLTKAQYADGVILDDTQFMQNPAGLFTQVRTGTVDNATAQPVTRIRGIAPKGGALNVNSPNSFVLGIYRADVLATDPVGGRVELQVQLAVNEGSPSYK